MPEFIDLGDVRTAFEVAGEGPPLLMLHGAEGSRRQFARILPALSDRYTVIRYDQRDCGDTSGPERAPTLIDLADDAMRLLEALGHASAFVFGTSFGGRVAQAFAVRHAKAVRRLVLASTWPLPVSLAQANAEVAREIAVLRAQLPASAEQLAALFFPAPFLAEHPAFRAHFAAAPARSARSDRRAAVVGDLPALALSDIDRPTLLVAGELDRVVPAALTLSLAQHIRDTRSVLLPGVGHLGTAQAPEALALHLREFLA
ncbi:alpha/beta fold hydrolase [Variovorax sp.]|jgi:pimeloyl-ACP methyl ester carboxylesterase|uniref:alpha/beta fold hydrolase n=1 Tax=Variovorax sp. TaxID=1871043 RepID=UPI00120A0DDE|nr:alpha/beta hydrolase [Variovorax sp.]TAJ64594.1 MAG: alpha/beta fold hydrolase [Variovorax sp.]